MSAPKPNSASSSTPRQSQQRPFTESMRDRQSRGKDPYAESEGEDAFDISDRESFRTLEQRWTAAQILSDPELLMMHAVSRQDSIPGTRLHFTRLLCGYEDEPQPQAQHKGRYKPRRG